MIDYIFMIILLLGTLFSFALGIFCLSAANAISPQKPKKKPLKKKRDPIITFDACLNYGLAVVVYYGMIIIAIGRVIKEA